MRVISVMITIMVLNAFPVESKRRKHKDVQTENAIATSVLAAEWTVSMAYLPASMENVAIDIESKFMADSEHEYHRKRAKKYSIKEEGEVGETKEVGKSYVVGTEQTNSISIYNDGDSNHGKISSKGAKITSQTNYLTTFSPAATKSGKSRMPSTRSGSKSNKSSNGKATLPNDRSGCTPDQYAQCEKVLPSNTKLIKKCKRWRCL